MCAQEQRHAAVQAKHEAAAELAKHQELREADACKMAALIESQAAKEKQHGRRAAKLKQKEEEMQVLENEVRRNPPVYPLPFFALRALPGLTLAAVQVRAARKLLGFKVGATEGVGTKGGGTGVAMANKNTGSKKKRKKKKQGAEVTDEMRTNAVAVDTTGDGVANAVGFDTTGDGFVDAIDVTGDGVIDVASSGEEGDQSD